jgi:hypothetical protein
LPVLLDVSEDRCLQCSCALAQGGRIVAHLTPVARDPS